MAAPFNYYDYITGSHELYQRYADDWRLAVRSYWGGVEYRDAQYLRSYAIDQSTASDVIKTYDQEDGVVTGSYTTEVRPVQTQQEADTGNSSYVGSFYNEKLNNVPVLPYTRLYVNEYNAILFRSPPVRNLPDEADIKQFIHNCDGEGNSLNEFMSMVDTYSTVYGVVWVSCLKLAGADYPRWRMHSPLDVLNWKYGYDANGDLKLKSILLRISTEPDVQILQHITEDTIETIFMPLTEEDIDVPEGAEFIINPDQEEEDKGFYRTTQVNPLGYPPVSPIYQSNKIYNGIGHTPVFDIAQIQRSIYGDYGEIYSSISYGAHPVTVVDETTLTQNDFNVGAEPGSVINVQNSLNGQPNYVFEFVAPPLDSIKELRELIDQKISKMNEIAMIRSEELIKASRSGVQLEMYDSKLEAMIRKKAVSLENAEANVLWPMWFDWQGLAMPEDLTVSYNRLYNQKGLENELNELDKLLLTYERFEKVFGPDNYEDEPQSFATPEEAEAMAQALGGTGIHSHEEEGITIYMPFETHEEYTLRVEMMKAQDADFGPGLKEKIQERLTQLVEGSYTNNSL
tara:strand:- start:9789 stop:11498 length:1710 start_codon:yes stop_codon:yes gene_type:complete